MITKPKVGMWLGMFRGMGGSASPRYLLEENFEADPGYDTAGWTSGGTGTINPDYTTIVLRGTQSLYLNAPGGATTTWALSPSFTETSDIWIHFRFRQQTYWHDDYPVMVSLIYDSTEVASLQEDLLGTDPRFVIKHGTVSSYGAIGKAIATLYHIWIHYIAGTGANGTMSLYVDTDGTRPVGKDCTDITTGSSTNGLTSIRFRAISGYDAAIIVDQVLISSSEIIDVDV